MSQLILYGTLGCHLCELAEAQLAGLLAESQIQQLAIEIECIDISDDDALLARYAERIPVLQRVVDKVEIDWPFEERLLRDFLAREA
jgi:hypothetical protein